MDGVYAKIEADDLKLGHDVDRASDNRMTNLRRQSTFSQMVKLQSKIIKDKSNNSNSPEQIALEELKEKLNKEFSSPNMLPIDFTKKMSSQIRFEKIEESRISIFNNSNGGDGSSGKTLNTISEVSEIDTNGSLVELNGS